MYPGDLAILGLVTTEVSTAEATGELFSLRYTLVGIAIETYVVQAVFHRVTRYFFQSTAQKI